MRYKSLITGKFVPEYYAKRHPKTTEPFVAEGVRRTCGLCKDCRFWGLTSNRADAERGVGACLRASLIGFPGEKYKCLAIGFDRSMAELKTTGNFGCVQFEAKA